jgi:hypothetical protein
MPHRSTSIVGHNKNVREMRFCRYHKDGGKIYLIPSKNSPWNNVWAKRALRCDFMVTAWHPEPRIAWRRRYNIEANSAQIVGVLLILVSQWGQVYKKMRDISCPWFSRRMESSLRETKSAGMGVRISWPYKARFSRSCRVKHSWIHSAQKTSPQLILKEIYQLSEHKPPETENRTNSVGSSRAQEHKRHLTPSKIFLAFRISEFIFQSEFSNEISR